MPAGCGCAAAGPDARGNRATREHICPDIIAAMDVARLIRNARTAAGLTQRQLARAAGTSQPTVARYEKGDVAPSLATLERLLRAAGLRLVLSVEPSEAGSPGPVHQALEGQRAAIREILSRHGARGARVFGSVARGQDRLESDLDLIVDMAEPTYIRLAALRADLESLLGIPVDVTVESLLEEPAQASVDREAVAL
jgi:uncharacterized protein